MKQPYIETGSGPVDVTIAHGEPILAIECDCPSDAGQVLTITQLKRWGTDFKTLGKDVDAELAVATSAFCCSGWPLTNRRRFVCLVMCSVYRVRERGSERPILPYLTV